MIRRIIAISAFAISVALTPVAVHAAEPYPAPSDALTCSLAQVAPGSAFTCRIGGKDGSEAQLQTTTAADDATIAGTVTSGVKVITNNVAEFTVTPPDVVGAIGITAIIDGVAVDTAVIVVAEAGGSGVSGSSGDDLSATGFENGALALGAGVLLVVGAGAVFVAARRRSAQNPR